jgi:uncharacterized protein
MRLAAVVLTFFTAAAAAEEVTLQTPTGTLYGTLLISSVPSPVVLIIAGSGPTDRDGNSSQLPGKNNKYRMLAEALAARGIASLRYDKRGVGASIDALGDPSKFTLDIHIEDAVAWLQQLRSDPRFSMVGIVGHSLGSLIGIVAAQRVFVERVISLEGAGRPAGDLLLSQLEGQLSPELMSAARSIVASLNAGVRVTNVPAALYNIFGPPGQSFLISWFRYDPAQEIARLTMPVLIVQGTTDRQVTVNDAERLAEGNRSAALAIITGMNHVLKDVPPDPDAQDRSEIDPTLPIDAALVRAISAFVSPQLRRRAAGRF